MSPFVSSVGVKLLGSGACLPGDPVSTADLLAALARHCDPAVVRRARAIAHRLGIEQRHLSRDLSRSEGCVLPGLDAPTLCRTALEAALGEADRPLEAVQYLVGHTTSPHTLLPPNIAWVADSMLFEGPYMELRQACTGFASALQIASAMIAANELECVAVVGSEVGSPYFSANADFTSPEQLVNYVQMGDGAGAVALGPDDGSGRSVLTDLFIGHIGNGATPSLSLAGGGSGRPRCSAGFPVFEHRVGSVRKWGARLFELGAEAVRSRGYELGDFRWILPHQASGRLAAPLAAHLGVRAERIHVTADRFGNLGSAAIWVALDTLRRSGLLAAGERVLVLGAEATKMLYGGFVYTH